MQLLTIEKCGWRVPPLLKFWSSKIGPISVLNNFWQRVSIFTGVALFVEYWVSRPLRRIFLKVI
jgi:hypothetical protein